MAANEQLESFLKGEAAAATAAPEPTPSAPTEAPAPEKAAAPEAKAEPAAKAATAKPEAEEDTDPEPSDRIERDGKSYIPQPVLERERQRRQDWKEKAARLEGELNAMRKQQEEAQRRATAPQPQQQQPPQPPPDPAADPRGYAQYVEQREAARELNGRLNMSEMMLKDKIGEEKLNEYIGEFRNLANADPSLFGKLYSQPHPYAWLTREVDRLRLVRDVGDDPAAFRAKIEAEVRARWEQEAKAPPAPSPAANMQPSLGTARSVAGRTAGAWTGEPSLEDVLAPVQTRKQPNGQGSRF